MRCLNCLPAFIEKINHQIIIWCPRNSALMSFAVRADPLTFVSQWDSKYTGSYNLCYSLLNDCVLKLSYFHGSSTASLHRTRQKWKVALIKGSSAGFVTPLSRIEIN